MSNKTNNKEKVKKPSILRNGALKLKLKNSLLNLNAEWVDTKNSKKSNFKFNSVDLFSGAGGISCGFDMAGLKSIMGIEIDPIASETYKNNFPDAHQINEDITKVSEKEIKKLKSITIS